jgi:hypothetical protein
MSRRHDSRRKVSQEMWICQNSECHSIVNMNDDALLSGITTILNRMIADPSLIEPGSDPTAPPMEVRRLQNEVDQELDSFEFDKERAQKILFELAREKYRHIDDRQVKSYMVRAAFEQSEMLSSFIPDIFKHTVLKVRMDADGNIALVLKNNQIIGKEDEYADSNLNATAGNAATDNPTA